MSLDFEHKIKGEVFRNNLEKLFSNCRIIAECLEELIRNTVLGYSLAALNLNLPEW